MKYVIVLVFFVCAILITGCSDSGDKDSNDGGTVDGGTVVYSGCPMTQPSAPNLTCEGDLNCFYGFLCCCDVCSTATRCTCRDRLFRCVDTGVCDNPWCERDGGMDSGVDSGY